MKLRSILAGTAIATMALAGAPQLGVTGFTPKAEAAVNVSFSIFYDRLGQYGDWVSYDNDYVFIPSHVDADWRPYTRGHWVYARHYGWTWVSDEPFGWATYHYGRWGYAEDIGWYWVPGKRWAPAWVSWRRSNNYVVWAPLPPSRHGGGVDVSININVGDIPDYYWVAVPSRRFLAPDLAVVVVHDDHEIRQVVQTTEYIGTPRITNNVVVNNVINVNVIEQETGKQVQTVDVKTTNDPAAAKVSADQVTAFQGEIAADTNVKPQKLSDLSQVKKVKRKGAGANDQNATTTAPADNGTATTTAPADTNATGTGTATGTAPATNEASTPPATGKDKKKKVDTGANTTAPADTTATGAANAPATTGEQPATQAQDQQTGKKKKKHQNENASAPSSGGEQPAAQAQDQQTGKKKKKQQNENASAPSSGGEQPAAQAQDQQTGKKKKKQQSGEDATGSTSQAPSTDATSGNAPDQNANPPANKQKKGKGKKDQACDPSTDANCAPAQ